MRNERYASGSWCCAWFGLLSAVSFLRWCKLTTGGRIFQEEIARGKKHCTMRQNFAARGKKDCAIHTPHFLHFQWVFLLFPLCICLFGQRRTFAAKLVSCPSAAQLVGTSAGLSIPKRKPVHDTDLTDKNPEFYKRKDGFYDAHR